MPSPREGVRSSTATKVDELSYRASDKTLHNLIILHQCLGRYIFCLDHLQAYMRSDLNRYELLRECLKALDPPASVTRRVPRP